MNDVLPIIAEGIAATVSITLLSFLVGAVLGVPLVTAARAPILVIRLPARLLIDLIRAVPPIVWLFLVFFGLAGYVPLSPYPAAVIGLGVVTAAYMAEIYRAGLLAVKRGQREAAQALGLGRVDAMRSVIGPQAIFIVLPGAATWLVALLKETAVVSIIGVADITFIATAQARRTSDSLEVFVVAGALYLLLSLPVALLSRWVDARVTAAVSR
jgi:polar amino acid transport system permease protein